MLASPAGWSGKTLVLVHAFKMNALTWSLVWNELRSRGHRVIALDLPGHGESNVGNGEGLSLGSLAEDLRVVLDHLNVSNGALVGHSLGGFISIQYLLEYTSHAAQRLPLGFVCVSCTAGGWHRLVGGAGGNWHGNLLMASGIFDFLMRFDFVAHLLMAKKFGRPSLPAVRVVVEASRIGASRRALKGLSDLPWKHDLHPVLQSLRVPSVVVVGVLDKHHPHPVMSVALRADFNATGLLRSYVVLRDVGHFIPLMRPLEAVVAIERLWA